MGLCSMFFRCLVPPCSFIDINMNVSVSQAAGDHASLTFIGDAVAVYGGSSFDHGDYSVSLDGFVRQLNGGSGGLAETYHPKVRRLSAGISSISTTHKTPLRFTALDVTCTYRSALFSLVQYSSEVLVLCVESGFPCTQPYDYQHRIGQRQAP